MDHKPLTTILNTRKSLPAAARIQRWAIILPAYQYEVDFRPTQHANADRYPIYCLMVICIQKALLRNYYSIHQIGILPVGLGHLCQETAHDTLLSKELLFNIKMNGWSMTVDPKFATIGDNSGVWMSDVGNQSHCTHKFSGVDISIFTVLRADILIFLSNVQKVT